MNKNYLSILKKADELAKLYLTSGPDAVSFQEEKGFIAVQNCYFTARSESDNSVDTILHFAEFLVKDILQKLENKKGRPLSEEVKGKLVNYYISILDEAIGDSSHENKEILSIAKEKQLSIINDAITKHDTRFENEFKSRLQFADLEASKYLNKLKSNYSQQLLTESANIQENYLKAFDVVNIGTKEEKEYYIHCSDYFLKRAIIVIQLEPEIVKMKNHTLSINEFNNFLNEVLYIINSGIKQNTVNRQAFLEKREAMTNEIKSEFAKMNIMVKKEGCYIATAVYGSYYNENVLILRRYRDDALLTTTHGRFFVRVYYFISPYLVKYMGNAKWFRTLFKFLLDICVQKLQGR
jgi:hypothetical protein